MSMYKYALMLWLLPSSICAQLPDSISHRITLDAEFRPRTEFRNGYRQLRTDTSKPALFTDQRSRLLLTYERKGLLFHTSIQDIRVWGAQDPKSTNGSIQIFETYIQPTLAKGLAVRIGRQKLMYDNQRLFAQNDWRQNGGVHDAITFLYSRSQLKADAAFAFNQTGDAFFGTQYLPQGFSFYKVLMAGFLQYQASEQWAFFGLHATDAFQKNEGLAWRHTSGGRSTYKKGAWELTLATYLQYGHTPSNQPLQAFYMQPEIQYKDGKRWTLRLGAEIFSGDDALRPSSKSYSFDALYGVNHRFLGTMDYFTRFPSDLNNAGLEDFYLFAFFDAHKKLTLRADMHWFYSQNNFVQNGGIIPRYLGFENDLLLQYKPNNYTQVQLGFSYMLPTASMAIIKKGGTAEKVPTWAFLMMTFKPQLWKAEKK